MKSKHRIGIGLFLVALLPAAMWAHENAVLESPQTSVPAGGSLSLDGRDFSAGEGYALRLIGALREYDLRQVAADGDGVFSLAVVIPADVVPGAYQVTAVAPDGDVAARLDMVVLEASADARQHGEMMASDASPASVRPMARADEIEIERDRSGLEWGFIGLLIGLAGGLGLGLLRRPRRRPTR